MNRLRLPRQNLLSRAPRMRGDEPPTGSWQRSIDLGAPRMRGDEPAQEHLRSTCMRGDRWAQECAPRMRGDEPRLATASAAHASRRCSPHARG